MTPNWLNTLGDRNPQLLRELRGRCQTHSVAVTIGLAMIGQVLLLLFYRGQIPEFSNAYTDYCFNKFGRCDVDWIFWWRQVCRSLTLLIPYVVLIPATFMLVTDISNEAEKGTLNFLRLSPRSSANILLGKLFGVPILSYLTILLLLPLHILSALLSATPLSFLLSTYFALGLWGGLLLAIVALLGLLGGSQPKLIGVTGTQGLAVVVLVAIAWVPMIWVVNAMLLWPTFAAAMPEWDLDNSLQVNWFGLAVNQDWPIAHGFLLLQIGFLIYWLWRLLQRSFRQPTATIVSKRQSYVIAVYFVVLLLGFTIEPQAGKIILMPGSRPWSDPSWFQRLAILSSSSLFAGLPLIFALSTPRQMLLDWLQGRRETIALQRQQAISLGKRRNEQIREWMFGEKSPGITAIWICILLVYCLMSFMLPLTGNSWPRALVGLCLSAALMANYSLLVQLCLLLPTTKRYVWALGSLMVVIIVATICSALPGINWLAPYFTPGIWIPLIQSHYGSPSHVETTLYGAIVALIIHGILLIAQVTLFRDQLRQLGRSEPRIN
jgi:hypothetical protein